MKPLSLGGENIVENLQVLTDNENKAKGDQEADYRNGRICTKEYAQSFYPPEKTYKKHDWDSIQFEYVSTQKTYAQIAEQFQVHEVQLRKRAAEESWTEKREKFATNLLQDVTEMARKDLAKENFDVLIAGIRTFQRAVQRWEYDGSPATLREIVDLWKPLAAALGETTARTANVDETEFDDADIIEAAERVARRAERKAKTSDYLGSSESEAEFGAGWSD